MAYVVVFCELLMIDIMKLYWKECNYCVPTTSYHILHKFRKFNEVYVEWIKCQRTQFHGFSSYPSTVEEHLRLTVPHQLLLHTNVLLHNDSFQSDR